MSGRRRKEGMDALKIPEGDFMKSYDLAKMLLDSGNLEVLIVPDDIGDALAEIEDVIAENRMCKCIFSLKKGVVSWKIVKMENDHPRMLLFAKRCQL